MDAKSLVSGYKPKINSIEMNKPWDKKVYYRELTSLEMKIIEKVEQETKSSIDSMSKIIVYGVVTKDGEHVFEKGDSNDLLKLPPRDLIKLGTAIMEVTQKDIVNDPKD